jgi:hypothetical protein
MINISEELFDSEVRRAFKPISEQLGVPLEQVIQGVYQLGSHGYWLRIRRGTGHRKDFLITLSIREKSKEELSDAIDEVGLGVIVEYKGSQLPQSSLDSLDDWKAALEQASRNTQQFLSPYLTGECNDFDEILNYIERKVIDTGIRGKTFRFPRNVREEWL